MFEWIEKYCEEMKCDWATAAREYHRLFHPDSYTPEDYEEE